MNTSAAPAEDFGTGPKLYCLWALLAIGLALAKAGLSPENLTRLGVLAFLLAQLGLRRFAPKLLPKLAPKTRFILLGTALAAVVEGLHMISMPVFLSLRIGQDTSVAQALGRYALDLLFTVPAYLVIFRVIWHFIEHYPYTAWHYTLVMSLGQTLGDGGLWFFLGQPGLLLFLPYPMSNYHAINLIPFLAVRGQLRPNRPPGLSRQLAIPAVILAYLVCGSIIKLLGRFFGFEPT